MSKSPIAIVAVIIASSQTIATVTATIKTTAVASIAMIKVHLNVGWEYQNYSRSWNIMGIANKINGGFHHLCVSKETSNEKGDIAALSSHLNVSNSLRFEVSRFIFLAVLLALVLRQAVS